ncbi:hypothetical protein HUU62_08860 [Rhodoferax sp. 4810]|uniref:Uncharacterized protein n=1 Tax=Thiospirillum jenense TaxID=1653858 RepID=A0A839HDN2_9GAMM|nr:hypothetical protein [Thiospirillum jenense]MBB1074520.1 hypothetical protein [Rhodoferax jenense]MBB1125496.1 hypothetical protein [Thiospirillum jenense]
MNTVEDVVYTVLRQSVTPLTAREIYDCGAKEFYSMDQLSRLLYDLKKDGIVMAEKAQNNQNLYYLEKIEQVVCPQPVDLVAEIRREGESLTCACVNVDLSAALLAGVIFIEPKMPRYAAVIKQAAELLGKAD